MLGAKLAAEAYLQRLNAEISRINLADLQRWSDLLYRAWEQDRFVYIIGNGGSGTTASHMAEDLGKSTLKPEDLKDESKKRLKVLSLTDNAGWIMAVGNDVAYDQIFVQQLMNYGRSGDVLIAISGSGNSPNILTAVDWANRHGLVTFGLTGYGGGKLKAMQQHGLHVALDDMGMVESIHLCLFHWVLNDVYARINREGRHA
jgi:D-sedoheptulose 7-phosphate isomerase